MSELELTLKRLCEVSRKGYLNPYLRIQWMDLGDLDYWFMSPEFLSLYGTDIYAELTEKQQRSLSFFETVNFFSLNIHGEKSLIEGLAHRLYKKELSEFSEYIHHFLDEENKHMIYFGGFCQRYAGKIYKDRKLVFPRDYAEGEEDFLFFARVMIFEELVDYYNVRLARDERLESTCRQINLVHHLEESRHLVFGREVVAKLFDKFSPAWTDEVLLSVRQYLEDYFSVCWKEYYNPDVYRDAGLKDPHDLVSVAWHSSWSTKHRLAAAERCRNFLVEKGILLGEAAA